MEKKCSKCGIQKPITDFHHRKQNNDGYSGVCKQCRYKYNYEDKYPRSALDLKLRKDYGITLADYDIMFEQQCGVCAICGKPQPKQFHRLAVDHDHVTGKVRGLLCQSCNGMLGLAKDNITTLCDAIKYLEAVA